MSSPALPPLPPLPAPSGYDKNGYIDTGSIWGNIWQAAKDTLYEAATGKISDSTKARMAADARKAFPGSPDVAASNVEKSVAQQNALINIPRLTTVVVGIIFIAAGIFAFKEARQVLNVDLGKGTRAK